MKGELALRKVLQGTFSKKELTKGNPVGLTEVKWDDMGDLEFLSTSEKYPELSFYKKGDNEKFVLLETEDGRYLIFEHYIFEE
jgi:hypothetical protein